MKTSHRKLRIAMLASDAVRIPPTPPEKYVPPGWSGAPELVIHNLTEELVKRGHDVTLFASGDSQSRATIISTHPEGTAKSIGIHSHRDFEDILISKAYQLAQHNQFDIIHSHFDTKTAHYAPLITTPTLSTIHGPIQGTTQKILEQYKHSQYYVSISNNQRQTLPTLQYAATIYHGVRVGHIPFRADKQDFLIFVGRIRDEKGVAEAIEVAQKTDHRLFIFGSIDTVAAEHHQYWLEKVKPLVDNSQIIYKGMLSQAELFKVLSQAKAFIFPLKWEEPFGLVAIEAMAAGTPTITFARGSMPEIVQHGKTGFVVKTLDEMIEAVSAIDQIKPADCREHVEKNFSIDKMVDSYEQVYYDILAKQPRD